MTDSLRDCIAAVHQTHRWGVFRCNDGYARTCCRCQWRETKDGPTHAEHVADAVIAELGLRRESRPKHAIAVRHESDCGKPGIFSEVTSDSEGVWTVVIEHYDEAAPLTRIGIPCRYTAANYWQINAERDQ